MPESSDSIQWSIYLEQLSSWIGHGLSLPVFFALVAIVSAAPWLFRLKGIAAIQVFGALLIMSVATSTENFVVKIVSVFVIATLVTELQFLEKIAALIWNRKEYWAYLAGNASQSDIEAKAAEELRQDEQNQENVGGDEVEPAFAEGQDVAPEGLLDTTQVTSSAPETPHDRIRGAVEFHRAVTSALPRALSSLNHKAIRQEVRLIHGGHTSTLDALVETKNTHFIIEIKNIINSTSAFTGIEQLRKYQDVYENYLRERGKDVRVRGILIVPKGFDIGRMIRGVPVAFFDARNGKFEGLDEAFGTGNDPNPYDSFKNDLRSLLIEFLSEYSRWAFSPLRIFKWGSKQSGYSELANFSVSEIKMELENLLKEGVLEQRESKLGNKLYIYACNG